MAVKHASTRSTEQRVLHVLHEGQDRTGVRSRQLLVDELGSHGAPFSLPELPAEAELDGRAHSIERRLPGRSVKEALEHVEGRARAQLIEGGVRGCWEAFGP